MTDDPGLVGHVLREAPSIHGAIEAVVRLGAAWLLWECGVSLGIAPFMTSRVDQAT
ncbi:hypothetical protein J3E64_001242 [Sphingobium sp. OAS761]|uniref:hypothetical protein n=1 Tax=Sphingobium sp. OAS761 TaxID=2817901 RepID=UPI00209F3C80|nr:hypothetical protein [Sphingobium sp. OAS761]MCP1469567.1 hypothetical protein [Sphingobium sp. OAS761]